MTTKTPTLPDAYVQYLVVIKGYSKATAKNYRTDVIDFIHWYKSETPNARWSTATLETIDQYVINMTSRELKPSTINRHLSAIAGIYNFFIRQGLNVKNPVKFESRKKLEKKEPNTINTSELQQAIEHADQETALALSLLYVTGMRAQELLDIETNDINWERNSILVHGKGMKERTVFFLPEHRQMLLDWLQGGTGRVFTFRDQRALRRAVKAALEPWSRARQQSPHAIRHTFATEMTSKGMPTATLASLMGHTDIKTTQKYVNMNNRQKQEQFLRFSIQ